MVFLELAKDNTKVTVTVGFSQNDAVPSLEYHFGLLFNPKDFDEMDSETLIEIFKVAEANVNSILAFDRKYDYDCQAEIDNGVTISKCCCDDETDKPYFVDFPKQLECYNNGECYCCIQKCPYDD